MDETEQPDHITVFERGPYLQTALICQTVLQEQDGVLSIIRVIDRLIVSAAGQGAPEQMPPIGTNLTLLITLKSGPARGTHPVRITLESPSGLTREVGVTTVMLEGEDRGQNIVNNMAIQFTEEGLYWFGIYFRDKMLTRVPFRIIYARSVGPLQPGRPG